jgi:hypothetical protein
MDSMSDDVFRVSMTAEEDDGLVAELYGTAAGTVFPISDPLMVPAGVLAAAAGVAVEELPGLGFVPSGSGWVPADTMV